MSSRGTEHKTVLQDITITSEPIRKVTNSTEFQKEGRSGTRQKEIAANSRDRAGHEIPHNLSTTNTHTSTTTKQLADYVTCSLHQTSNITVTLLLGYYSAVVYVLVTVSSWL